MQNQNQNRIAPICPNTFAWMKYRAGIVLYRKNTPCRQGMSPLITAAIAVFFIAALLFWQMKQQRLEGFSIGGAPVGGRPYGAVGERDHNGSFLPADLHKMPFSGPAQPVANLPASTIRPITVPGPITSVRDPPATQVDMQELNTQLITWLTAIDQRNNEHPGSSTPEQNQQRVLYEARSASILDQLGSGNITDTRLQVAAETREVKRDNEMWKRQYPNIEELAGFGLNLPQDEFLTAEQYNEFRGLFDAVLKELREIPQPDPLNRVRYQQLQVLLQDLETAERKYTVPPIKMRSARLFLQRAVRPDQPLPTLFAMDSQKSTKNPPVNAKASDMFISGPEHGVQEVEEYDPKNYVERARTLSRQIQRAFPRDAEALGCPMNPESIITESDAMNVIGVVCDRLRYSVPSVTPAQFNCPPRNEMY